MSDQDNKRMNLNLNAYEAAAVAAAIGAMAKAYQEGIEEMSVPVTSEMAMQKQLLENIEAAIKSCFREDGADTYVSDDANIPTEEQMAESMRVMLEQLQEVLGE